MNRVQLGLKLKDYRNSIRKTQDQLGEYLKMDPKKISRIERGIQFPEEWYLDALVRLGATLDAQEIKQFILEVEQKETASTWSIYPDDAVTNHQLLTELRQLRQEVLSLTKKVNELCPEEPNQSTTARTGKPIMYGNRLEVG